MSQVYALYHPQRPHKFRVLATFKTAEDDLRKLASGTDKFWEQEKERDPEMYSEPDALSVVVLETLPFMTPAQRRSKTLYWHEREGEVLARIAEADQTSSSSMSAPTRTVMPVVRGTTHPTIDARLDMILERLDALSDTFATLVDVGTWCGRASRSDAESMLSALQERFEGLVPDPPDPSELRRDIQQAVDRELNAMAPVALANRCRQLASEIHQADAAHLQQLIAHLTGVLKWAPEALETARERLSKSDHAVVTKGDES